MIQPAVVIYFAFIFSCAIRVINWVGVNITLFDRWQTSGIINQIKSILLQNGLSVWTERPANIGVINDAFGFDAFTFFYPTHSSNNKKKTK